MTRSPTTRGCAYTWPSRGAEATVPKLRPPTVAGAKAGSSRYQEARVFSPVMVGSRDLDVRAVVGTARVVDGARLVQPDLGVARRVDDQRGHADPRHRVG